MNLKSVDIEEFGIQRRGPDPVTYGKIIFLFDDPGVPRTGIGVHVTVRIPYVPEQSLEQAQAALLSKAKGVLQEIEPSVVNAEISVDTFEPTLDTSALLSAISPSSSPPHGAQERPEAEQA